MRVIVGKKCRQMSATELIHWSQNWDSILIDLGTGDGRFVLDQARKFSHKLCIGVDAVADAMRYASHKTTVKPERGGVSNALFIWAGVEELPPELHGMASEITINFPWGSLLHALVDPNHEILKGGVCEKLSRTLVWSS